MNVPEVTVKLSQSAKIAWSIPEVREKYIQSFKITSTKPEVKENHSLSQIKLWQDPIYRENQLQLQKIAFSKPEIKEKISQSRKKSWQNPIYKESQLIAIGKGLCILPNKPETHLSSVLSNRYLGKMKYTGDYSFTIGGKCPDFISTNGQKKIIELYGDYWHRNDDPQDRIDLFKQYGYDTLIIWEHELKDMDKLYVKLDEFMRK